MKNLLILCLLFLSWGLQAQTLSLSACQEQARQNYPLVKQKDLLTKSKNLTISNLQKQFLPQITLNAQATYQSDVTKLTLDVPIPNFKSPEPLAKDQYKVFAELSQTLFDGGIVREQKKMQNLQFEVENQKNEIELYKIRERVNQLFFGILLLDEQVKQLVIVKKDLEANLKKMQGAITNGTALRSNADILEAELLKTEQKVIEVRASRGAFLEMLGLLTNQTFAETVALQKPDKPILNQEIKRPELQLFAKQSLMIGQQNHLINARNLPKIALFGQLGYGRPAFNFLKNSFETYYIGGVRLVWNFGNFYTTQNEKQLFTVQQSQLEVQKQTFLLNTNLAVRQQNAEVQKLEELMGLDNQLISLRTKIKNTAQAQMESGVISTTDFLRELNAEDQAKQSLILHEIQWLLAQHQSQFLAGYE